MCAILGQLLSAPAPTRKLCSSPGVFRSSSPPSNPGAVILILTKEVQEFITIIRPRYSNPDTQLGGYRRSSPSLDPGTVNLLYSPRKSRSSSLRSDPGTVILILTKGVQEFISIIRPTFCKAICKVWWGEGDTQS
jgi:hypothetical protein